jgi:molybdopterin converting factor small subunit
VLVNLNSTLRGQAGRKEVSLDLPAGTTVQAALEAVVAQVPVLESVLLDKNRRLRDNIVVFHNGRNIRFKHDTRTPLAVDDRLDIFPETGTQRAFASD